MIIIPARAQSQRFPKKVLADIGGLPMVIRTAKQVEALDAVVIATDSYEIASVCQQHGFEVVLTSASHKSGTDRISEAATILKLSDDEPVINVQADEPFIEPSIVEAVINRVKGLNKNREENTLMVSCYNSINSESADDPNLVKVVLDAHHNAIYFSRSKIPFSRDGITSYFGHIGIYGFTKKSLEKFCTLDDAPIEDVEKLEQLRAIYHGFKIAMVKVSSTSFGIDTPEDLERAKAIFLK